MFELILITTLSQTVALPSGLTSIAAPAEAISTWSEFADRNAEPPALVNATNITWRASVEEASVANDRPHSLSELEVQAPFARKALLEPVNPTIADVSYDAMLAKRWHWFELYGASRLHRIPKESRMPWWFAY